MMCLGSDIIDRRDVLVMMCLGSDIIDRRECPCDDVSGFRHHRQERVSLS